MSKTAKVFAHLKKGKAITSWQAFELYYVTRLADIVYKLRCQGYEIHSEIVDLGNTKFAKYRLIK